MKKELTKQDLLLLSNALHLYMQDIERLVNSGTTMSSGGKSQSELIAERNRSRILSDLLAQNFVSGSLLLEPVKS